MWGSDIWVWVFLFIVIGIPMLILLILAWMLLKTIRHGDWSAERFAWIKPLLTGRRREDQNSADE